ncbi:MAG: bifunctional 5,10-methylenetetrahydrofolate dehydrogenase/5,10-methenyltetrahydrofolate cyclohydrolase [Candidatus Thermoplasmatota archaeon]|nr:bifunctional 5,10-methylenetetrahydrofolate dehydrogenase/5,10-methenyltetrahydrofolate cyclohydrolase [Candidatus Thermoplasmatota archaeon]
MAAVIYEGRSISDSIAERIKREIEKQGNAPKLSVIRIGKDAASASYFKAKIRKGHDLGVEVDAHSLPPETSAKEAADLIDSLAADPGVDGIMLENEVPEHLSYVELANRIPYWKDVDGATYSSLGRLMSGAPCLAPATPLAVMEFMKAMQVPQGSSVAIINRTITVGKPLSMLMLSSNYTPFILHSRSLRIHEITRSCDVIVVAAGHPGFLTSDYVTDGTSVIDVGINSRDGQITGDADFEKLAPLVRAITPVPGGVGAVTSTMVFSNLMAARNLKPGK